MNPCNPQSRISLFLCLLLALPAALPLRAQQEEVPGIAIVPQDGFNMKIVDIVDLPEQLTVITTLDPPVFNWFAGTFTNLPTDKEVTIGLNMTGMDSPPNKADVSKWVGLRPVFTYADPTRYESYEWFQKDEQGRWVNGDPLKRGNARYAGTGRVPFQDATPADLADQFLSTDGDYWSPWREIDETEVLTNINIFRMRQTFDAPDATVAMRVPYTYTYLQEFLIRLQAAQLPGVTVDEVGKTPGGRSLQVIRVSDPDDPQAHQHSVLVIAREHATEPSGSWVVQGMLQALISEKGQAFLQHQTLFFIPIEDPDGSAGAIFDRLTEQFKAADGEPLPEVFGYCRYFSDYIAHGGIIDLTLSLHNVEANEIQNVFCPFTNHGRIQAPLILQFNRQFFTRLRQNGYATAAPEYCWGQGWAGNRLYARVAGNYGALDMAFEINDRFPDQRLSLTRLQGIGVILLEQLAAWKKSDEGRQCHQNAVDRLELFRTERQAYFTREHRTPEQRSSFDIIMFGY